VEDLVITGKRKLIAGLSAMGLLTVAAGLQFLTPVLMQGIVGALLITVGGNAAEHFAKGKTN
jgi:ABC-type lipoprotein release transport system permease subunit